MYEVDLDLNLHGSCSADDGRMNRAPGSTERESQGHLGQGKLSHIIERTSLAPLNRDHLKVTAGQMIAGTRGTSMATWGSTRSTAGVSTPSMLATWKNSSEGHVKFTAHTASRPLTAATATDSHCRTPQQGRLGPGLCTNANNILCEYTLCSVQQGLPLGAVGSLPHGASSALNLKMRLFPATAMALRWTEGFRLNPYLSHRQ